MGQWANSIDQKFKQAWVAHYSKKLSLKELTTQKKICVDLSSAPRNSEFIVGCKYIYWICLIDWYSTMTNMQLKWNYIWTVLT